MAKLLKLRRGTTSQHNTFTGAEGEVTIDTTKDTAVVHDGSTAGGTPLAKEDMSNVSSASIAGRLGADSIATTKIAGGALPTDVTVADANISGNLTIESADIVDGTIVNADVNASAAIAGTKISPDFGSQNVTTTGTLGSDDITITGTKPKVVFEDSNNENDYHIQNDDGTLAIKDVDADVARLTIATNGQTNISGNLDCAQGLDVTGNITGTGNLTMGEQLTLSATTPNIVFTDTNNDPDYRLKVDSGAFTIEDAGDNSDKFVINSDGHIDAKTNLDCEAGVDVTGNITVSGTVDGRDVAADGTKLDTVETNAKDDQTAAEIRTLVGSASDSNVFTDADHAKLDALTSSNGTIGGSVVLANGVIGTTQSAGDASTKIATTAYVDTAAANVVHSAPGALDTLNELAAALGDDANFSTTVSNNIATKMPLAGGEFTGDVTSHNITPDGDSSRNLGTNSVRFANVYADNFVGGGGNLTGIVSFVSGMIIMYNSSSAPSGWYLCDGNNGTPDLRDRFIVGAGNSYSHGATGGSNTATDNVNVNVSVSGSTSGGGSYSFVAGIFRAASHTVASNGHQHSFSGSGSGSDTVSIDTRSPYYALTFIMKA